MNRIFFCLLILFSWFFCSGEALAFPGESYERYFKEYGSPSNLRDPLPQNRAEKFYQFYWQNIGADPLSTGKKLKGNLIVLFENHQERVKSGVQGVVPVLSSTQETLLARIAPEEFDALLKNLMERWKIRSKTRHTNLSRTYDLYELVSVDEHYELEISYSPLEAIVPFPDYPDRVQAPLFNFWIHITSR